MKQRLVFLVAAIFAVLAFVGCSSKEEEKSSSEVKTIHIWHKETGVKKELFQRYIDEFMKENPGINVVVTQTRGDAYKEKLPVSFSGGQQPDVFFTWGGSWLKTFIDAGHVMDLTDKIDTTPFRETTFKNTIFDDKLYGVPLGLDIGFVYYNKEIFAQYGLEVPTTYDELIAVGEVLKANDVTPFVLANQTRWPGSFYFMYLVDRIGGIEAFDAALSREESFNSPVFLEAGEKLQNLASNDFFNIGFNGVPYDAGPGRQLLYTGDCAMMVLSNTFVNLMRAEAPDFEEKMGIFPFPAVEGGKGNPNSLVGIASPVWSVSAATKYPEESIKLVELLTSKELSQEYANTTGSQSARNDVKSEDSFVQQLEEMTANAPSIQMVYDQTLPPELVDAHLSTTQEILGETLSSKDAADKVESVAKKVFGK